MPVIIPQPSQVEMNDQKYQLSSSSSVVCPESVFTIATYLAGQLRPSTGYELPIRVNGAPKAGDIVLELTTADSGLGEEGYELIATPEQVTLRAPAAAGLFYAVQTLRQMLPAEIESAEEHPGMIWEIECGKIRDIPRYTWRASMLDVGRHFFGVAVVKRLIDLLAYHKINILHLHLTDDQGWRIMIESWPWLALHGGSTATNGDPGGYYTQDDYREIVLHAQKRYVTIIPEIDMPGHTNAALASYAELNANGEATKLYTGIRVGFSSLAIHKEITYRFIHDVVREIAALTPGKYFHFGGDETHATLEEDYIQFVEKVQDIVVQHGKQPIGWEEIGKTRLRPETIAQFWWNEEVITKATEQGNKVIVSPAKTAYMDIKYHEHTTLGQVWTKAYTDVKDAYDWEPTTFIPGVPADSVLGVACALWTETIFTQGNLDFMVFPRLCGYAEIGWSPAGKRNWEEYRTRLAAHGQRLKHLGVQFYRSEQVDW